MKTSENLIIFLIICLPFFCFSQTDIIVDVVFTNVVCNGQENGTASAFPDGGTNPYTYQWSNGATTQTISDLPPASYVVTVTDANGITAMNGTIIQEPDPLEVTIQPEHGLCGKNGNATASVFGGSTPYTFLWGNGEESFKIEDLPGGNYQVTVTDRNGCEAANNIDIIVDDKRVEFDADITRPTCFGEEDGSIDIKMVNGTAPYAFYWDNQVGPEDLNDIGIGSYTIFITDDNGCHAGRTISVGEPEALELRFINEGNALIGRVLGGITPYNYKWSTGTTGTAILSDIGQGTYGLTVTDANGCTIVGEGDYLGPLSNKNLESIESFSYGPNPAIHDLKINLTLKEAGQTGILLYDLNGKVVDQQFFGHTKEIQSVMNLENISQGIYVLVVNLDGEMIASSRVVVGR